MNEIWLSVKGYDSYEVSNCGDVRSKNRTTVSSNGITHTYKSKDLKVSINRYGYYYVDLYANGNKKKITVHRLVAEAFIDTDLDPRTCVVNHIDRDKNNNNIKNLEWATYTENAYHGKARLKVKAKEVTDLLDLLEQLDLDQINKVLAYAKRLS